MTLAYFDSSALLKLLRAEEGSDLADHVWDACSSPMASRLGYVEVCAALAAAHRRGELTARQHRAALREWDALWAETRPVELTAAAALHAGALAERHGLRGADAVHLASALAVGSSDLLLVVWDARLREAGLAEGLLVVPAA